MENSEAENKNLSTVIILLSVIVAILSAWALKQIYIVAMPLALAFFIAILVEPVHRKLTEKLPPGFYWLSLVIIVLLVLVILGAIVGAIWLSVNVTTVRAGDYTERFEHFRERISFLVETYDLPVNIDANDSAGVTEIFIGLGRIAFSSLWNTAAIGVLAFFYLLLMLLEVTEWQSKSKTVLAGDRYELFTDTIFNISVKVRRFLLVRSFTSFITGVLTAVWLLILGVDFAILWGLVAFLLNYIPYLGSVVAVIPPTLMGFIQLGFGWSLLTLGGLTVIQQIVGNFIDPRMQGRNLKFSPLILLVSIIFWGWIWGVAGALMAVPLTATLIITFEHVPQLRPIAILLGSPGKEKRATGYRP